MTLICVLGTELSALVQRVTDLRAGRRAAAVRRRRADQGAGNDAPAGSIDPELSWFSPFAVDSISVLVLGLLTGVFIYWGWESAVNLNEETEDSDTRTGPGGGRQHRRPARHLRRDDDAVVAFAGLDRIAEYEDDTGLFGAIADGRARERAGLDRRAGDHHVGARLDADDDPAGVAHGAVDGAPGRVPGGASAGCTRAS